MQLSGIKHNRLSRILALLLAMILFVPVIPGWTPFAAAADEGSTETSGGGSGATQATVLSPSDPTKIGAKEYYEREDLTDIIIPNTVTEIGDKAFEGCINLKSITISNKATKIGASAFEECASLKSITIPGSVISIGENAFAACYSLESVYILYGVQSIGDGAFANCQNLKTISIAPSVAVNGTPEEDIIYGNLVDTEVQAVGSAADYFSKIENTQETSTGPSIHTETIDSTSPVVYDYKVVDDGKGGHVVVEGYFGVSNEPTIPDQINGLPVEEIGDDAFNAKKNNGQNTDIVSVKLPKSLTTIGTNAFAGCPNLGEVEIPESVTGMGDHAFDDCIKVTLIVRNEELYKQWKAAHQTTEFILWEPGTSLYNNLTVEVRPAGAAARITPEVGLSSRRREAVIDIETEPKQRAGNQKGYRFSGWTLETNQQIQDSSGNLVDDINSLIENPNITKTTLKMPGYPVTLVANFVTVSNEPLVIEKRGGTGVVLESTAAYDELGKLSQGVRIPAKHKDTAESEEYDVTRIGDSSYNGGVVFLDTGMKHLFFGTSITFVHDNAFDRAYGLEQIYVEGRDATGDIPTAIKDGKWAVGNYFSKDGVLFQVTDAVQGKATLVAYPKAKTGPYTVPDGVTSINSNAFYNCSGLKSIDLNQVTSIGSSAFFNCTNLESVSCGALTRIPSYAFAYCGRLKTVDFQNVNIIDYAAFMSCSSLGSDGTPLDFKSVTSIGSDAFYYCRSLTEVNLKGVKDLSKKEEKLNTLTIGSYAFAHSGLKSVEIPAVTTTISSYAFYDSNLASVTWEKGCTLTVINSYVFASTLLKEVTLPTGTGEPSITISDYAYSNCNGITKVTLTPLIKTIGSAAFAGCDSLEEYALEAGATYPEDYLYSVTDGVLFRKGSLVDGKQMRILMSYPIAKPGDSEGKYIVPEDVEALDKAAMYGAKFTYIDLSNVKKLDDNSLAYTKITAIDFKNVTTIGVGVFEGCGSMQMVGWPIAISEIPADTFLNCTSLTHVKLPDKPTEEGATATGVTKIGNNAFAGCTNLESVDTRGFDETGVLTQEGETPYQLPSSLTSIGSRAFYNCRKLGGVIFPDVELTIGTYAFASCISLKSVDIASKVKLEAYAFADSGLTTLKCLTATIPSYAFRGCSSLTSAQLAPVTEGENPAMADGGVQTISDYAFYNCSRLSALETNATTIGYGAFWYCSSITNVNLPKVTSIGMYAFSDCSRLKGLTLKDAQISNNAFQNCTSLETLELTNVGTINNRTFSGCTSLKDPKLVGTTTISSYAFANCTGMTNLDVSASTVGPYAFSGCSALESVNLPEAITIDHHAFQSCGKISTLNMGKVQTIETLAFQNCNSLEALKLPKTIAIIGERAFTTCEGLKSIEVEEGGSGPFFSNDGVLYRNALASESKENVAKLELFQYPQSKPNATVPETGTEGTPGTQEPAVNASNGTYNTNYFVGSVDGTSIKKIHDYAFESNNNLESIEFSPDVNEFGQSVFFGSDKIKELYILSNAEDRAKYPIFNFLPALADQGIFYGVPDSTLANLIVYGYSGTNTEIVCLQYKIKKVKFVSLSGIAKGLTIRVWGANGKPDDPATTEFYGEVIGYNPSDTSDPNSDPYNVVIPGVINKSVEGEYNVNLVQAANIGGTENTEFSFDGRNEKATVTVTKMATNAFSSSTETSSEPSGGDGGEAGGESGEKPSSDSVAAKITSVTMPQTITVIDMCAFKGCSGLKAINIPEGVETIRERAFEGTSIETLTLPKTVKIMGTQEILNEETLVKTRTGMTEGASKLRWIDVASDNPVYSSDNGVLFTKDKRTLLEVPPAFVDGETGTTMEYRIPNTTFAIASSAFAANSTLTKVTIPTSVHRIGVNAFRKTFSSGRDATVIFDESKNKDDGPSDGLDIENGAFAENPGLIDVTLPWYTKRLGDGVFMDCDNIQSFHVTDQPEGSGSKTIAAIDGVLYGYTSMKKGDIQVENFALYKFPAGFAGTAYSIDDKEVTVFQIYKSAFQGQKTLESVSFSKDVQIVQDAAFLNCGKLQHVDFMNTTYIGPQAFKGTALGKKYTEEVNPVDLPISVETIDKEAFAECDNLTDVYIWNSKASIAEDAFISTNRTDPSTLTLHGYTGSTTDAFAHAHGYTFAEITESTEFMATIDNSSADWIAFADNDGTATADKSIKATAGTPITLLLKKSDDGENIFESIKITELGSGISKLYGRGSNSDNIQDLDPKNDGDPIGKLDYEMPSSNISISVVMSEEQPVLTVLPFEVEEDVQGPAEGDENPNNNSTVVTPDNANPDNTKPNTGGDVSQTKTGSLDPNNGQSTQTVTDSGNNSNSTVDNSGTSGNPTTSEPSEPVTPSTPSTPESPAQTAPSESDL